MSSAGSGFRGRQDFFRRIQMTAKCRRLSELLCICANKGSMERLHDPPGRHHRNPITHRHQFGQVAGGNQDRPSFPSEFPQQCVHLLPGRDIDTAGRLVEQQDLGALQQPQPALSSADYRSVDRRQH